MKKVALLFCIVVALVSCKKSKETVKEIFDITFRFSTTNDFTLSKISDTEHAVPDSVVSIKTPDITNTIPDEFKKNNADINKLKSLTIESVDLNIKSPAGQTFAFMKSVKVYLGATGKGEVLIATRDNINTISPAPTSLSLTARDANIVEYVKGATYYLKVETALVKTYTTDILVGSEIKFKAVANPLN